MRTHHRSAFLTRFIALLAAATLATHPVSASNAHQPHAPRAADDDAARWAERLVLAESSDDDWRSAFALGSQVAELDPPELGLEAMRLAWPRLERTQFKQQLVKSWQFDMPFPLRVRAHPQTPAFFRLVLDDPDPDVTSWAVGFLATYAWRPVENEADARAFLDAHEGADATALLTESLTRWTEAWRDADAAQRARLAVDARNARSPFRRNRHLADIAERTGAADVLETIAADKAIPGLDRQAALDLLRVIRPDSRTDEAWAALEEELVRDRDAERARRAEEREARMRRERELERAALLEASRTVGDDDRKRYLVHPPLDDAPPADGFALLLVLPGGDGSIDFTPFVSGAVRAAAGRDTVVLQLVAPPLSETPHDDIVWPQRLLPDPRVDFTIEPVARAAIDAVRDTFKIDPERITAMGWSSGGPPAYALALEDGSPVTGAVVVMSVFRPDSLPPLDGANDKPFAIIHSPTDFIDMRFPEAARDQLAAHGGRTRLTTYEGGHGWHGDALDQLADALHWIAPHD